MAGGGHASSIPLYDLAILIGATLLISSLTLMFGPVPWTDSNVGVVQAGPDSGDMFSIDLGNGDSLTVTLTAEECQTDAPPCASARVGLFADGEGELSPRLELALNESGTITLDSTASRTYTVSYVTEGSIAWESHVERRWMQPYLMPLLGAAILGWGIWQGRMVAEQIEEETP